MFDRYAYVQMMSGNLWTPMTRLDSVGEAMEEAFHCLIHQQDEHYRVTFQDQVVYEIWFDNGDLVQKAYRREEIQFENCNALLVSRAVPELSWQECGF